MKKIQIEDNFKAIVPEPIRIMLNIQPGDSIDFKQIENKIYVEKSI